MAPRIANEISPNSGAISSFSWVKLKKTSHKPRASTMPASMERRVATVERFEIFIFIPTIQTLSVSAAFTTSVGRHILNAMPSNKGKLPLSVTHPELAKEADGWDPAAISFGSKQIKKWKCSLGHTWEASVGRRAARSQNCPFCSGTRPLLGFNDLSTTHPDIANEAYGWDPTEVTKGSSKEKDWKCASGHIYQATTNSRTRKLTGCPFCAGQKILKGFNDLLTKSPVLASEADGWDPSETFFRSSARLSWKCNQGHIWKVSAANRVFAKSGCPYCSGKKVLTGYNDLSTLFPDLASQANGWDPSKVSLNSHEKFSWKCNCGFVWLTSPNHRVFASRAGKSENQVYGCPSCAGRILFPGVNDLAALHPEIAKQAFGWDPATEFPVSKKSKTWRCSLGHTWNATISNRTGRGSQCAICTGKQVLAGFNDLQTLFPEIAAQLVDYDPATVLAGTRRKYKWLCPNLHNWVATVSSRTSGGNGCPTCANSGFDPNDEGFLYFLIHPHWEMLQIGITNVPKRRMRTHSQLGWEIIELRGPMDGHLTRSWETAILRMLKAKGADLSNAKIAGKFDGFSEAWSKSTFEVKSIEELMKLTEEFEESKLGD